jgi:hypothetical protein
MIKVVDTPNYHREFNTETGFTARWGVNKSDDPNYSPLGPEIADIEISVNGCPNASSTNGGCGYCYKGNTDKKPFNMSLEKYKEVLDNIGSNLDQVALGLTGIHTNPNLIPILKETRTRGIVPNFTISGIDLDESIAEEVVKYVGAIAVSVYSSDKNVGYNAIRMLQGLGLRQANMHLLASMETLDFIYEVLGDIKNGIVSPNAVVFLAVKPKGRAKGNFRSLSQESFNVLMEYCFDNKIRFGMDSCSSIKFYRYLDTIDKDFADKMKLCVEPCESGLFSIYVNVHGKVFPCSFCEGVEEWKKGLDTKDVWFNAKIIGWRNFLVNNVENGCRKCPMFEGIN